MALLCSVKCIATEGPSGSCFNNEQCSLRTPSLDFVSNYVHILSAEREGEKAHCWAELGAHASPTPGWPITQQGLKFVRLQNITFQSNNLLGNCPSHVMNLILMKIDPLQKCVQKIKDPKVPMQATLLQGGQNRPNILLLRHALSMQRHLLRQIFWLRLYAFCLYWYPIDFIKKAFENKQSIFLGS